MVPTIPGRSRSSSQCDAFGRRRSGVRGAVVVGARREHDVTATECDVAVVAARARGVVERGDLYVRQREELALARVEVVGEPAAVALGGEADRAGEPVVLRLDDDPLLALLHAARP